MDDEVRVRVLHGAQHLSEQREARAQRQAERIAVCEERLTLDELEREVRLALRRDAGVVQARDVRMRESRENVALAGEAAALRAVVEHHVRQLEGDGPSQVTVRALGEPDHAHAPGAQLPQQPVGPDPLARREHGGAGRPACGAGGGLRGQQVLQRGLQPRVFGGQRVEPAPTRVLGEIEHLAQQLVERAQLVGGKAHGSRPGRRTRAAVRAW